MSAAPTGVSARFSGSRPDILFIIGTGRSGTNWLAQILQSHADFRVGFERFPMFPLATRMAVHPGSRRALFPFLVWSYRAQMLVSRGRIYADKSHPAIWVADRLANAFPSAVFLGVQRNPFATVSSMMRKDGVRAWHERWRRYPIPNEFLGISDDIAPTYGKLSLAAQCALRWTSHRERMQLLELFLGERLHVVPYEGLARDPEQHASKLQHWLKLETPFPSPRVKRDSVDQWKRLLSSREISDIAATTGVAPDNV